jgi:hypothetical protein
MDLVRLEKSIPLDAGVTLVAYFPPKARHIENIDKA